MSEISYYIIILDIQSTHEYVCNIYTFKNCELKDQIPTLDKYIREVYKDTIPCLQYKILFKKKIRRNDYKHVKEILKKYELSSSFRFYYSKFLLDKSIIDSLKDEFRTIS